MSGDGSGDGLFADTVAVLEGWHAPDADQEALRKDFLGYLTEHPEGLWKPCTTGHITAGVLVVDPPRERVLLTLHRKVHMWLQMGGHCEPEDATLAAVALREGVEESGVDGLRLLVPEPVRLDRHLTPCAWHLDVQYAAVAPEGAQERISEESLDLRWFGYGEAAEVADGSVRLLLDRTRALL